jgi:16S rRNA (uracil1498-N3)-methyltransferase
MRPCQFHAPRLFIETPLASGVLHVCSPEQANYLLHVLRLREGDEILAFNGCDGEWRARLVDVAKRRCTLAFVEEARPQQAGPDVVYLFAPLKHARLDYMVQKATEMGVARLQPVLTRRTVAARVNVERMRANVIEAAEQCGILRVPGVGEPQRLEALLDDWDPARRMIVCDEFAEVASPLEALSRLAPGPLAVLVGPEGGFDPEERARLIAHKFVVPVSLGPRILRADTAAVAALALVNAVLGDWR